MNNKKGEMMDALVFDAKRFVRPALRSIVFYLSIIVISSMTIVKFSHAAGTIPATILPNNYFFVAPANTFVGYVESGPCGFDTTIDGVGKKCADYLNSYSISQRFTYTGFTFANPPYPNGFSILALLFSVATPPGATPVAGAHFASVNTTIVCPPGYKYKWMNENLCELPNQLSIKIQGGTTTEPWNKRNDPDHVKANLPFMAIVTDQNGQAKANIDVSISSDVTQDSGGHIHNDNRPKGKLVSGKPVSTLGGKETLPGTTDSTGSFSFTFGAEEASGEHQLTATCTGCTAPAKVTVNVLIPGLTLLGVEPGSYDLQGYKDWHPGNHYFSESAIVPIINLAFKYSHSSDFNNQHLIINDSSLAKGGVFDLGQDWTSNPNGHQGHRKGVVVDINNYHAPSILFEELASDCCGITAVWEGPDVTATPHYHLWLLGRDE